jgi:hypothetical protein
MHPDFLNKILEKRASLVTMNKKDRADFVSTASTLSSHEISDFAERFADSFF